MVPVGQIMVCDLLWCGTVSLRLLLVGAKVSVQEI